MLSFFSCVPAPTSEFTSRPSLAEALPKRTRVVFAASSLGHPWGNGQGSKLGLPFRTLHRGGCWSCPLISKESREAEKSSGSHSVRS